jgi:hypothetical protein
MMRALRFVLRTLLIAGSVSAVITLGCAVYIATR